MNKGTDSDLQFLKNRNNAKDITEHVIEDLLNKPLEYTIIEGDSSNLYNELRILVKPKKTRKKKKNKIKDLCIPLTNTPEIYSNLFKLISRITLLRSNVITNIELLLTKRSLYSNNYEKDTNALIEKYSSSTDWSQINIPKGTSIIIIFRKLNPNKEVKMALTNIFTMNKRSRKKYNNPINLGNDLCGFFCKCETDASISLNNVVDPILKIYCKPNEQNQTILGLQKQARDEYESDENFDNIMKTIKGEMTNDAFGRYMKSCKCIGTIPLYRDDDNDDNDDNDEI